jgi:hypothetical protein
MRRPALIIVWIIVACVAWLAVSIGGLKAFERFDNKLFESVIDPIWDLVLLSVEIIGPLVVMSIVGYLGLHGKLPGTREALPKGFIPSAFPVIQTPQSEDAE